MTISLVAAIDINSGLGFRNQLLCKLPSDMKHFRELTLNQICVMGRSTYESIGSPLPKRTNLILSRDINYEPHPDAYVYNNVDDILRSYSEYGEKQSDVMVIGGASIYEQFLPHCDYIHLTIINHEFEEVDTYFPRFSLDDFKVISHIHNPVDDKNEYSHSFVTYERKS